MRPLPAIAARVCSRLPASAYEFNETQQSKCDIETMAEGLRRL